MLKTEYKLRQIIEARGYITIAEFMEIAISDPQYGYYASQFPTTPNLDFITAPEISQLFGEMVGTWAASSWLQMGSPENTILVELGPGRGTMMKDILRATKHIPNFHQSIEVHMVEISSHLQILQEKNLEPYDNVKKFWHDNIYSLPKSPMILVCNEFFDALPIHQYQKKDNEWFEIVVETILNTGEFKFGYRKTSGAMIEFLDKEYSEFNNGQIIEISPNSIEIIKFIADHLSENHGYALAIDYGYYFADKLARKDFVSTLQAVKRHKYQPIFEDIGKTDITALVDFNALKEAVEIRGMYCAGPIEQGEFLKNMGIDYRTRMLLRNLDETGAYNLITGLERLTSPSKMGSLFKVLAFTDNPNITPVGFYNII